MFGSLQDDIYIVSEMHIIKIADNKEFRRKNPGRKWFICICTLHYSQTSSAISVQWLTYSPLMNLLTSLKVNLLTFLSNTEVKVEPFIC